MEISLTPGAILLLIILVKVAKPNFFNFGTVINNNYHGKEPEQVSEPEEKKKLKAGSDNQRKLN
jgi:hypothetical protein